MGYILKSSDVGTLFSGRNSENSSHTHLHTHAHPPTSAHTRPYPQTPTRICPHPPRTSPHPPIPMHTWACCTHTHAHPLTPAHTCAHPHSLAHTRAHPKHARWCWFWSDQSYVNWPIQKRLEDTKREKGRNKSPLKHFSGLKITQFLERFPAAATAAKESNQRHLDPNNLEANALPTKLWRMLMLTNSSSILDNLHLYPKLSYTHSMKQFSESKYEFFLLGTYKVLQKDIIG